MRGTQIQLSDAKAQGGKSLGVSVLLPYGYPSKPNHVNTEITIGASGKNTLCIPLGELE